MSAVLKKENTEIIILLTGVANTVEDTCQGREKYCQRVRDFLTINDEWVRKQAEEYDFEPYWHQVRPFGLQFSFGSKRLEKVDC